MSKTMSLRSIMIISVCLLSSLAGVMSACKMRRDQKTESTVKELTEEEKKRVDEARAEMEIGRNMAGRLLQFYGVYDDKKLMSYVNNVGDYVAGFSDDPTRRYMFEIIDSDIVNAFACPGGYILVTLGAIRHAKNEAQLAHILAHEVAHVGKKHMFEKLKSMNEEEMNKVSTEAEKQNQHLPEGMASRKRPDPEVSGAGTLLARYLSGSTAGLSILAAAKAGMSLILEKGLGADLEYEADREGTKYAVRAGYDPLALEDFLCRLEKRNAQTGKCKLDARPNKNKKPETILDKTHPPVGERISNIDKVLIELDANKIIGAKAEKRFAKATASLPAPKAKSMKSEETKKETKE